MTSVLLLDRDNVEVGVDVKVLALAGTVAVFMSDRQNNTSSSISRNAATYLAQLAQRLSLHPVSTQFYRHVYHPQQGSMFGRFDIVWSDADLVSYKFVMLNNLDEASACKTGLSRQRSCLLPTAKPGIWPNPGKFLPQRVTNLHHY